MKTMQRWRNFAAWMPILMLGSVGASGCKSMSEKYIAMEVWKYERCFGHAPPGFVGTGAPQAPVAAPMQPCAAGMPVQPMQANCDVCAGAPLPASAPPTIAPGPSGMGVTSSRPVVISDELAMP